MNAFNNNDLVPADDTRHHRQARDWEVSRTALIERSERTAWRVAKFCGAISIAAVAAVVALTPLKQVVPYLIYVDQHGDTRVRVAADEQAVQHKEILDKHWINEYVIARERYYFNLLQYDYDRARSMSDGTALREYGKQFEGPNALQNILGRNNEYAIKILSVTLTPRQPGAPGTAVVRFEKTVRQLDNEFPGTVGRFIATMSYVYQPTPLAKEKIVIMNPLGFTVTDYRLDPELADATPFKPAAVAGGAK